MYNGPTEHLFTVINCSYRARSDEQPLQGSIPVVQGSHDRSILLRDRSAEGALDVKQRLLHGRLLVHQLFVAELFHVVGTIALDPLLVELLVYLLDHLLHRRRPGFLVTVVVVDRTTGGIGGVYLTIVAECQEGADRILLQHLVLLSQFIQFRAQSLDIAIAHLVGMARSIAKVLLELVFILLDLFLQTVNVLRQILQSQVRRTGRARLHLLLGVKSPGEQQRVPR